MPTAISSPRAFRRERITRVGNIMLDSFEMSRPAIEAAKAPEEMGLTRGGYAVVTLHRPSNVDEPAQLARLVEALAAVQARLPIVFPVHPRTAERLAAAKLDEALKAAGVRLIEPLPYIRFMSLMMGAGAVITDSGGLQEETTYLGIPCFTLRENTERPITVEEGTNRLATPESLPGLIEAALSRGAARARAAPNSGTAGPPGAASRISGSAMAAAEGLRVLYDGSPDIEALKGRLQRGECPLIEIEDSGEIVAASYAAIGDSGRLEDRLALVSARTEALLRRARAGVRVAPSGATGASACAVQPGAGAEARRSASGGKAAVAPETEAACAAIGTWRCASRPALRTSRISISAPTRRCRSIRRPSMPTPSSSRARGGIICSPRPALMPPARA